MTKSMGINEMHGGCHTRAYRIWHGMRDRCNNPMAKAYPNYGGRGITISEDWSKFSRFLSDMGSPEPGMTLERVDNSKGYSKQNCVWADRTTQGRNKRNNVLVTIDGETLPLSVWAERSGLSYVTVHQRIRKGWTPEAALKTPLVTVRAGIRRGTSIHKSEPERVLYAGERMTVEDAARRAGIKFSTVCTRLRRGWSIHDALSERPHRGPHKSRGANHDVVFHDRGAA